MKKVTLLIATALLILSCQQNQPVRFTKSSAEIDSFKKGIEAYEKADWAAWSEQFADTVQLYHNHWSEGKSSADILKGHKTMLANFSSYGFDKESMVMEQVIDDDGETWVNFWGLWSGTFRESGKTIDVPVHLTTQFVNGKVVEEYGFWDTAGIVSEMQAIAAANAAAAETEEATESE